jgi:hypothetical protein
VLINHGLEPFLEFWCGHPLPYVASAAVSTCAVTMLFAPALKQSQPDPHFSPGYAAKWPRSFESGRRDCGYAAAGGRMGDAIRRRALCKALAFIRGEGARRSTR